MKICVLIGNGFDLALGLKTGYKDFIADYLKTQRGTDNPNVKWLCERISADIETWGDAEIAFGGLDFPSVEAYNECSTTFAAALMTYLRGQNARFRIPEGKQEYTRCRLLQSIMSLDDWMMPGHKQYCKLGNKQDENIIDFLTFNYTDTLEQLLGYAENRRCDVIIKDSDGNDRKVIVNNICHVHGTLSLGAVFGVDSPDQIQSPEVRTFCASTGGIIKEQGAAMTGLTSRTEGVGRIASADLVIAFGLSFGKSDRSWWRKLWDVVSGNRAQFIVCPFDKNGLPAHSDGLNLNSFFTKQKTIVFNSLTENDRNFSSRVVTLLPKQFISLRPCAVDGHDFDYLRLAQVMDHGRKP